MIIIFYFLLSFITGIFFVLITTKSEIKLKNPTPKNINNILYIDDNNVCYKYEKTKITCPSDEKLFKDILKYY